MLRLLEGPVERHTVEDNRKKSPAHGGNRTHDLFFTRRALYLITVLYLQLWHFKGNL